MTNCTNSLPNLRTYPYANSRGAHAPCSAPHSRRSTPLQAFVSGRAVLRHVKNCTPQKSRKNESARNFTRSRHRWKRMKYVDSTDAILKSRCIMTHQFVDSLYISPTDAARRICTHPECLGKLRHNATVASQVFYFTLQSRQLRVEK